MYIEKLCDHLDITFEELANIKSYYQDLIRSSEFDSATSYQDFLNSSNFDALSFCQNLIKTSELDMSMESYIMRLNLLLSRCDYFLKNLYSFTMSYQPLYLPPSTLEYKDFEGFESPMELSSHLLDSSRHITILDTFIDFLKIFEVNLKNFIPIYREVLRLDAKDLRKLLRIKAAKSESIYYKYVLVVEKFSLMKNAFWFSKFDDFSTAKSFNSMLSNKKFKDVESFEKSARCRNFKKFLDSDYTAIIKSFISLLDHEITSQLQERLDTLRKLLPEISEIQLLLTKIKVQDTGWEVMS